MSDFSVEHVRGWSIASRACRNGVRGFIAWAKEGDIHEDGPLSEPINDQVWFEFGDTREEAVAKLKIELGLSDLN